MTHITDFNLGNRIFPFFSSENPSELWHQMHPALFLSLRGGGKYHRHSTYWSWNGPWGWFQPEWHIPQGTFEPSEKTLNTQEHVPAPDQLSQNLQHRDGPSVFLRPLRDSIMVHCLPNLPLKGEKLEAQRESGLPSDMLWQWQNGVSIFPSSLLPAVIHTIWPHAS